MEAPKCKLCGERHYGRCAAFETKPAPVKKPPAEKPVEKTEPGKKKPGRKPSGAFNRAEWRKTYMREYMRKRRAGA